MDPTRHRPATLPPCSALATQKPVSGAPTRSARASWVRAPSPSPLRTTGGILPYNQVSAGLKAQSADGRTSHLLSAKVESDLYDVPLLTFG